VTSRCDVVRYGGRVVFVTSHMAHYYGSRPVYPGYEPVAESKRAAEDSLQAMVPELERRSTTLMVVSGDLLEDTITPKLLSRSSPGLIEARRKQSGSLPTADEFASAIVDAVERDYLPSGSTVFVGNTEW
jgi:3-oxoacyl-[acyl-carrier protein] reductase